MSLEYFKQGRVAAYHVARCYAQLGQKDQAFAWLEKAYEEHDEVLSHLKIEAEYDNLHSDSRFQVLLHRVGFAE